MSHLNSLTVVLQKPRALQIAAAVVVILVLVGATYVYRHSNRVIGNNQRPISFNNPMYDEPGGSSSLQRPNMESPYMDIAGHGGGGGGGSGGGDQGELIMSAPFPFPPGVEAWRGTKHAWGGVPSMHREGIFIAR